MIHSTSIRDTSSCCHPLTAVPCLRPGPRTVRRLTHSAGLRRGLGRRRSATKEMTHGGLDRFHDLFGAAGGHQQEARRSDAFLPQQGKRERPSAHQGTCAREVSSAVAVLSHLVAVETRSTAAAAFLHPPPPTAWMRKCLVNASAFPCVFTAVPVSRENTCHRFSLPFLVFLVPSSA